MAGYRCVRALFIFSLVSCLFAQDVAQPSKQAATVAPGKVSLNEVSTVQILSLAAESIAAPVVCDPDGRILFRLALPDTGVEDPVSVSRDGKTVIRFGKDKINDIPRPSLGDTFLVGSDLYILTSGSVPLGYEVKLRTPKGEVISEPATKSATFVAHFEHDGRYAGAVRLDLPFLPLNLGVFENGDFLISGMQSMGEARLAVVGSDGQLRRFVELKGDVHAQEEADGERKDPIALPRYSHPDGSTQSSFAKTFMGVVSTSRIVADGPNLLLFRQMNGPVFSISPSGEVRVHKLKVKGDYRLFTIKPTRNAWIVEFMHDVPNGLAEEFSTYAFDREIGTPLREYFFSTDLGWGLACVDGDAFTFVMADTEGKNLSLVKLAPAIRPN